MGEVDWIKGCCNESGVGPEWPFEFKFAVSLIEAEKSGVRGKGVLV